MIEAVLLDLDDTLYDYKETHRVALQKTFEKTCQTKLPALHPDDLQRGYGEARKKIHKQIPSTAASHSRLLYFQSMLQQMGAWSVDLCKWTFDLYWETFLETIVPFDDVAPFFKIVGRQNICIVTDFTTHPQYQKLQSLGIQSSIHSIVTSEETGKDKPFPLNFQLGLEKLQSTPEKTIMIGDSFEKDILGAAPLGIRSIWLNREGRSRPEYPGYENLIGEVADLREVKKYV